MSQLSDEKYMYPIGLVFGLLWVRVIDARLEKITGGNGWRPIYAWIDILAIASATITVVVLTALYRKP